MRPCDDVAELLTCERMLHLCVCRAHVVELRTERFWTRWLVPERTGVQSRTRYGDMAPDCCTEYSLGKLYLTLLLPLFSGAPGQTEVMSDRLTKVYPPVPVQTTSKA